MARQLAWTAGAIGAALVAAAFACLPDLAAPGSSPPPPPVCGDGFIDPSAGEECDPGDAESLTGACASCKAQCPKSIQGVLDPKSHHCYFAESFTTTIDGGAQICEQQGGHVVRLVSDDEMALVADAASTGDMWIGLVRTRVVEQEYVPVETTPEPGWRPDCAGCYARSGDAGIAPQVLPDGSVDVLGLGACVVAQRDLGTPWTQSVCRDPGARGSGVPFARYTLCEREPVGTRARPCGNGLWCFTTAATSKRYTLVANVAGASAPDACGALGGRLLVLGSREEREQIAAEIEHAVGDVEAWIGLSTTGGGQWAWDDGATGLAPASLWAVTQPSLVSGAGRAFLHLEAGVVDSELARTASATPNDPTNVARYAVCEQ